MKRQITISLDAEIAHRLEIRAAINDLTLSQGIEELVEYLYEKFTARKTNEQDKA